MSKYRFLAEELNDGLNPISGWQSTLGLLVFEENGKKFFKTISDKGTSETKYKLSTCEIIFDTTTGKVFFQPTAESAAKNPRYAMIVPPIYEEDNKLWALEKSLKKIADNEERFFRCGGELQGFFRPIFEKDAIQEAKGKGFKKFYCIGGPSGFFNVRIPKKLEPEMGSIDQIRKNAVIKALTEKRDVVYEFGSANNIITLDEAKKLAPQYLEAALEQLAYQSQMLEKTIASIKEDISEIITALNS